MAGPDALRGDVSVEVATRWDEALAHYETFERMAVEAAWAARENEGDDPKAAMLLNVVADLAAYSARLSVAASMAIGAARSESRSLRRERQRIAAEAEAVADPVLDAMTGCGAVLWTLLKEDWGADPDFLTKPVRPRPTSG